MTRSTVNSLAGLGGLLIVFGLACLLHVKMNDYNPYDAVEISRVSSQGGHAF